MVLTSVLELFNGSVNVEGVGGGVGLCRYECIFLSNFDFAHNFTEKLLSDVLSFFLHPLLGELGAFIAVLSVRT